MFCKLFSCRYFNTWRISLGFLALLFLPVGIKSQDKKDDNYDKLEIEAYYPDAVDLKNDPREVTLRPNQDQKNH